MQPAPPPWASPRQSAPLGSGLRSARGPPDSGAATPDGGLTRSAPRRPPRGPCLSLRLLRTDYSRDRPASPAAEEEFCGERRGGRALRGTPKPARARSFTATRRDCRGAWRASRTLTVRGASRAASGRRDLQPGSPRARPASCKDPC